jgi:hypothetical protein
MTENQLARIAELLHQRNLIDEQITQIIHRPMAAGHLGEWIASRVFDIELETSAVAAAIDGRFRAGPLRGKTVNIKWYLKREGMLDMTEADSLDFYLVMTGPPAAAASSTGTTRPWRIDNVYLFDARQLLADQRARGVKIGIASSVSARFWDAAEIYPSGNNPLLPMTQHQSAALELFRS